MTDTVALGILAGMVLCGGLALAVVVVPWLWRRMQSP